jgi:hypothetical protein
MIRQEILEGQLTLPTINGLDKVASKDELDALRAMFEAMFRTYLQKGEREDRKPTVALTHWSRRVNNQKLLNKVLKVLSKNGWIVSSAIPGNRWGEAYIKESKLLKYVTKEELDKVRQFKKYNHFKLTNNHYEDACYGKRKESKFSRHGFAKAGKTEFRFNTAAINRHHEDVLALVNKGIVKMMEEFPQILDDHANYEEVGKEVLASILYENGTYSSGPRKSDARGRDIAGYLNKIGNPVGFKVMRGLLVIPEIYRNKATINGLTNKYLFAAELLGWKSGHVEDKVTFGRDAFFNHKLPHDELEELPERLWLLNTYEDIRNALTSEAAAFSNWEDAMLSNNVELVEEIEDQIVGKTTHHWVYPIEIDMSASVIGFKGLLLDHKPFLDRTNILEGKLSDAWGHDIITNRPQFKTIMRQCYGSQLSAADMWSAMDIPFTEEEVAAFNYELDQGEMSVAARFKDFVIDNCRMKEFMEMQIGDETLQLVE